MSDNPWSKFNDIVTAYELDDIVAVTEPIKPGNYFVRLIGLVPTLNKKGLPLLEGRFQLEDGRQLFHHLVLQNLENPYMTRVSVKEAVDLISGLLGTPIVFTNMAAFFELIRKVPIGGLYTLTVEYSKKDTIMKYPNLRDVKLVNQAEQTCNGDCGDHRTACGRVQDRRYWSQCEYYRPPVNTP